MSKKTFKTITERARVIAEPSKKVKRNDLEVQLYNIYKLK